VTVDYATSDGTAAAGSDYTATSGTLTFAPHESAKTIVVPITADGLAEGAESFALGLSNPVGATIAGGSGLVTIGANGATASANPSISAPPDLAVNEGDGYVDLVVSLAVPGSNAVSVNYMTASGTAIGNNGCNADFLPADGTLTFLPGETTKVVRIHVYDCNDPEPPETFNLLLSGAVNGVIADSSSEITIIDNDGGVGKLSQTISFAALANKTFGDSDFAVSASASSGLPVSFGASGSCTISGASVHLTGAGSCTITASQAGNGSYDPAPSVARSFTIAKASQTINFAALANKTFGDSDFAVSASASSGLAVSFGASGNCTISGATVHLTGAGSCTITASQAGNASYDPAPSVARSFAIAKASQTISFAALADRKLGSPDFDVSASASSGLAVAFAASGGHCTISGNRVHLVSLGLCTITSSQAGSANYSAASSVPRSFTITPKAPTPPKTCTVPKLVGKKLAAAETAITNAHCRVGTITRVFSRQRRAGIVIGQSLRPGKTVKRGTKVNLVVSRGRRR
jgi:hypothetical protein